MVDITYSNDFTYRHRNPYHEKLSEFDGLVLRDHEAEAFQGKWNSEVFKRSAPLYLEIGSGFGHFMLEYTEKNPDINFVGLDYRFKRGFNLARKLSQRETQNFRYLRAKGERVHFLFAAEELDGIFYFFPDPWPREKHHKKRLFQKTFLEMAHRTLRPGGKIFVKTDHDGLGEWMEEIIKQQDLFSVELATRDLRKEFPNHFLASFQTKFEKIFIAQNVNIKAFVLSKKVESSDTPSGQ